MCVYTICGESFLECQLRAACDISQVLLAILKINIANRIYQQRNAVISKRQHLRSRRGTANRQLGVRYVEPSEVIQDLCLVVEKLNTIFDRKSSCGLDVSLSMASKAISGLYHHNALSRVTNTDRRVCSPRPSADYNDILDNGAVYAIRLAIDSGRCWCRKYRIQKCDDSNRDTRKRTHFDLTPVSGDAVSRPKGSEEKLGEVNSAAEPRYTFLGSFGIAGLTLISVPNCLSLSGMACSHSHSCLSHYLRMNASASNQGTMRHFQGV